MTVLRAPRPGEAAALSALILRSKAHWGYDAAFIAACAEELRVTEAMLDPATLRVAEYDGALAGVAVIAGEGQAPGEAGVATLALLFVDPDLIGTGAGVGRALVDWAKGAARAAGAHRLTLDADPGAEGFYARLGAARVGASPSGSIPGRVLPRMEFRLAPAPVTSCP